MKANRISDEPTLAAARQRRYRRLQKVGKICVTLTITRDDAALALESIGALPPALDHDRAAIEAALQEQVC